MVLAVYEKKRDTTQVVGKELTTTNNTEMHRKANKSKESVASSVLLAPAIYRVYYRRVVS